MFIRSNPAFCARMFKGNFCSRDQNDFAQWEIKLPLQQFIQGVKDMLHNLNTREYYEGKIWAVAS